MSCQSQILTQQHFKKHNLEVVYKNFITLHYSIVDQKAKKHEFGCGLYVRGEFLKYVKDFKIIDERICYLRLKAKWFSCTLINVYAPTNKKADEIKKNFIICYSKI